MGWLGWVGLQLTCWLDAGLVGVLIARGLGATAFASGFVYLVGRLVSLVGVVGWLVGVFV